MPILVINDTRVTRCKMRARHQYARVTSTDGDPRRALNRQPTSWRHAAGRRYRGEKTYLCYSYTAGEAVAQTIGRVLQSPAAPPTVWSAVVHTTRLHLYPTSMWGRYGTIVASMRLGRTPPLLTDPSLSDGLSHSPPTSLSVFLSCFLAIL